jgi:hypothetical protein
LSASPGKDRCNVFASSNRAHSYIALLFRPPGRWRALDWKARALCSRRRQEAMDQVGTGDRLRLRAALAFEFSPDADERKQGTVVIQRKRGPSFSSKD